MTLKGDPVALKSDGNRFIDNKEALKGNEEALKGNQEAKGVKKRRSCATGFAKRWRGVSKGVWEVTKQR